ncbi:MAG: hypothetical protein V1725_07590 [archaeon]
MRQDRIYGKEVRRESLIIRRILLLCVILAVWIADLFIPMSLTKIIITIIAVLLLFGTFKPQNLNTTSPKK